MKTLHRLLAAAFTQRRLKKPEDAAATLKEIASHRKADDWVMAIVQFMSGTLTGDDNRGACQGADVVVLSIPYSAHAETLRAEVKAAGK